MFSTGKTETSGFYTFGGTWSNQTVVGVQWLTAHATTTTTNAAGVATESYNENACRLKATRIGTGATHARAARFPVTRFKRAGGRRHPLRSASGSPAAARRLRRATAACWPCEYSE